MKAHRNSESYFSETERGNKMVIIMALVNEEKNARL